MLTVVGKARIWLDKYFSPSSDDVPLTRPAFSQGSCSRRILFAGTFTESTSRTSAHIFFPTVCGKSTD